MPDEIPSSADFGSLGFPAAVQKAFSFLIVEHGFRPVRVSPVLVRYETRCVFVEIILEALSYELSVAVGILDENTRQCLTQASLGELLEVGGVREPARTAFLQGSTPERIARVVPRLAEIVHRYAGDALAGAPSVFNSVYALRARRAVDFERQRSRANAERSWREKDYSNVVRWYGQLGADLRPLETARLKYAAARSKEGQT